MSARKEVRGALDLARRGLEANAFEACAATFDQRAWGASQSEGERFELVVGSDLIYDPGVVAPLIATAVASLAPGGRFLLAQSFALGDESAAALAAEPAALSGIGASAKRPKVPANPVRGSTRIQIDYYGDTRSPTRTSPLGSRAVGHNPSCN